MDIVGADYVCLSDECSQDAISLWSDPWSVGDPVSMPEMDYDDQFNDVFLTELVHCGELSDDNGDWPSEALESACPDTVTGYVPLQVVTSSGAHLSVRSCAEDCDGVLSPTDSGHHSNASSCASTTTAQYIADDLNADGDELCDELSSQLDNNNDIHLMMSHELPVKKTEDIESVVLETEAVYQRPQRAAAHQAEVALAREETDSDDDADDVEDACYRRLRASEMMSSRRGRSRALEVNRNALNARINRQKKKAYMTSLEAQKTRLLKENEHMKSLLSSLVHERDDLVDEVKYLKSVLANDSVLAKLVESINGPPLKLSARFDRAAQKRKDVESDHNYGPAVKLRARPSAVKAGGICLHVNENHLSMELCHRCASMAKSSHDLCLDS